MKKTAILTVALLLLLSTAGWSQLPSKPFNIYVGGGVSQPSSPSDFTDYWKLGFHGSGGLGINFGTIPKFQLVGKVEYHTFAFDWDQFGKDNNLDVSGVSGLALQALMFGADARLAFGLPAAPLKPFVIGGAGMANVSFSDASGGGQTVPVGVSETKLYFNFGGGLEFGSGPAMKFFIQARYVSIATSGSATTFIPITAGLKF